MQTTPIELPQWKRHEVVKASKITDIGPAYYDPANDQTMLVNVHTEAGVISESESYLKRTDPRIGGYYVQCENGYSSYSPADAFEAGYKPLGQSNEEKLRAALLLHIGYSDVNELKALRDVCAGMPEAPPEDVAITLAAIDALIETTPAD